MGSVAHIRQSDGKVQTVEEHLISVQKLASRYGRTIGVERLAGLAGVLHDVGKYSNEFRNYLLDAVSHPERPPKRGTVDHSTAGGKMLYEGFHSKNNSVPEKIISEIVGNAIISHHMGLQDFLSPELESDYLNRVSEKPIDDFQNVVEAFYHHILSQEDFQDYVKQCEIELTHFFKQNIDKQNGQKLFLTLLTKYIFSCLIDADRTDTRCFEEKTSPTIDSQNDNLFEAYYNKLTNHLSDLNANPHTQTTINQLRAKMSQECDAFAEKPSGIYTLSIPTGGGKTLASLRYALKHAVTHQKERIIYVVPYTTIIEQNAEEVKRILEDRDHILEHHSNVVETESDTLNDVKDKSLKLAKDNWDAPVIFTTMVQFLNAFYSKGTRNVRRLHHLANAVIIFDEVQSVPIKCVSLFNEALNFLKGAGGSSILLCTATQPALDFVQHSIEKIDGEIVQDLEQVTGAFKRVDIIDKTTNEGWDTEALSDFVFDQLQDVSSVLVILNTKTVVRRLFSHIKETDPNLRVYHLSTSMCAAHRKDILAKVNEAINHKEKVVCLSTQLIEAGVDISFECVIRSLAGLDSIAQAAGRCNRHGEFGHRNVYIINHKEENLKHLQEIATGARITKQLLIDRHHDQGIKDLLSSEALTLYFQSYYEALKEDLDYFIPTVQKNMFELLKGNVGYRDAYWNKTKKSFNLLLDMSIKTAANHFKVIDNQTTSLLVPYKEGHEIIAEFNGEVTIEDMTALLKKAQHYTVNVYQHEIDRLSQQGDIQSLLEGKLFCLRENAYDLNYGVNIDGNGLMEEHFI
ncbi:CRISPR-associated endonuclease/helicase Cas3 [Pullulanibacillus pueri]|nr:CRISPR-associated helicase Cas3' [Pullulanibacillus pueri]MBM7682123.1 CRISPR-associated endonuclease/helicase Cas3 [Pullulanibacillus pueri]